MGLRDRRSARSLPLMPIFLVYSVALGAQQMAYIAVMSADGSLCALAMFSYLHSVGNARCL